jgi:hypothetical protein
MRGCRDLAVFGVIVLADLASMTAMMSTLKDVLAPFFSLLDRLAAIRQDSACGGARLTFCPGPAHARACARGGLEARTNRLSSPRA